MRHPGQPKRNPENTNQFLHYGTHFRGLPVSTNSGPLILSYLEGLHETINAALIEYPTVLACKVDLHYLKALDLPEIAQTNWPIELFLKLMDAELQASFERTKARLGKANPSRLRCAWAREVGPTSGRLHYHLVLLLNGGAYRALGDHTNPDADHLYNMMRGNWAFATEVDYEFSGLVSLPPGGASWLLTRDTGTEEFSSFFRAASCLTKAYSKEFNLGHHSFGVSRG